MSICTLMSTSVYIISVVKVFVHIQNLIRTAKTFTYIKLQLVYSMIQLEMSKTFFSVFSQL